MTRKRTKEEVSEILLKLGYIYQDEYRTKSGTQKVIFLDSVGYKYDATFGNILDGIKPRTIGKENPFALDNIGLWLRINGKTFSFTKNTKYTGSHEYLELFCETCTETFHITWGNLSTQNQGCPFCAGRKVGRFNNLEYLRPDIAKEWNYKRNSKKPNEFTLGSNKKVWWLCDEGHEWEALIYSRTLNERGCRPCSFVELGNRFRKSHEKFVEEIYEMVDDEYSVLSEYRGVKNKVKMIHNLCGHIWDVSPNPFLKEGTRCPKCKFSKGEVAVEKWLFENKINYTTQMKFDGCIHKKRLSFDFYLPDYNLCIEYDGTTHYLQKFDSNEEEFLLIKKTRPNKNKILQR